MEMFMAILLAQLVGAAPFVATWNITQANETVKWFAVKPQPTMTIDWGDSSTDTYLTEQVTSPTHIFAFPGLYNMSIEGPFLWMDKSGTSTSKLVDIVSWGDVFMIDQFAAGGMFSQFPNLEVSASPDTQPVFLPGARLTSMFDGSSFNSPLNWDLTNVTSIAYMFRDTPLLNQPINFRNTQGVVSVVGMFQRAAKFNQPFHFDASGLLYANLMFENSPKFNQIVNLTNSTQLRETKSMFSYAIAFNQPVTFNVDSVTDMSSMFLVTGSFNQPINFSSSSSLTTTTLMFAFATQLNQPVTMDTSNVVDMHSMFSAASHFASTVHFTSTANVRSMDMLFRNVHPGFTQDLSSWDVRNVTACSDFCSFCGLPAFSPCSPCRVPVKYSYGNFSTCSSRAPTAAPSAAPSTKHPSTPAPSSLAPSAPPSAAPSSAAPSSAAPSSASPELSGAVAASPGGIATAAITMAWSCWQ